MDAARQTWLSGCEWASLKSRKRSFGCPPAADSCPVRPARARGQHCVVFGGCKTLFGFSIGYGKDIKTE